MLGVCQEFPQFSLNAVDGSNNIIEVTNADLDGKWSVVYFYPKDFTFILFIPSMTEFTFILFIPYGMNKNMYDRIYIYSIHSIWDEQKHV